jgi:hypothetical protein
MVRLTLFCTSCAATSPFFERSKVIMTCAKPSEEVDRISSNWLMVLTASSIFLVISASISSGEAPGFETVTATVGISMLGN